MAIIPVGLTPVKVVEHVYTFLGVNLSSARAAQELLVLLT